ncbi:MAG: hypothetical protein HY430_03930 [Candidatus Levybacteria bacterium]|nr:hypothetical protein [Candidatus Levybacteria bacterium]
MSKNVFIIAAVVIILGVLGFVVIKNNATTTQLSQTSQAAATPTPQPTTEDILMKKDQIEIPLDEQSGSGVSGSVKVFDKDGKAMIRISLTGDAPDGIHPAHLHAGSCALPGDIKYPLNDVVNGKSETTLTVAIGTFKDNLPLILNVHESAKEIKTYIACGEVTTEEPSVSPTQ